MVVQMYMYYGGTNFEHKIDVASLSDTLSLNQPHGWSQFQNEQLKYVLSNFFKLSS